MKKNIVLIQTIDSMGTGIMYPAQYDNREKNCKSYIVFTNSHVLEGLETEEKSEKYDWRSFLVLQVFDDFGKVIPEEAIKRVFTYKSSDKTDMQKDVAALLIQIDDSIPISLNDRILSEELEDRSTLYMEGYPNVLLNDEVNQKLQLKGISKKIFPENEEVGVYQIADSYHWYNDFKDIQLLQGFSGSPVYVQKEKESYLIGMNQSISNIYNGENPFKLVYYLKIEHILKILRKSGCIIFRKNVNGSYQIEWIYGKEKELDAYENKPVFMMIGGSGAGKSSFAIDFAANADLLNVSNDGQTTRTSIIYNYKIVEKEKRAEVVFLEKEEFCDQMKMLSGITPILSVIQEIFGFSERLAAVYPAIYIQNCYYLIEYLIHHKKGEIPKWFLQMEDIVFINTNSTTNQLELRDEYMNIYGQIVILFQKYIPLDFIPYICDLPKIYEVYEQFCSKYLPLRGNNDEFDRQEQIEMIKEAFGKEEVTNNIRNLEYGEKLDDIIEIMRKHFYNQIKGENEQKLDVKKYQCECVKSFYNYINKAGRKDESEQILSEIRNRNNEILKSKLRIAQDDFLKQLCNIHGFFSLEEFDFLGRSEIKIKEALKPFIISEELFGEVSQDESLEIRWDKIITEFYEKIYNEIFDSILKCVEIKHGNMKVDKSKENVKQFTFYINKMTEWENNLLTYCLQVQQSNSLTGVIKYVNIYDDISNQYALLLKELKISCLQILDTYGLDHIEWSNGAKDSLYDIKYRYGKIRDFDTSKMGIVYLKKLDSGRPDELKEILPMICEVWPQSPIYCAFSGLDLLYGEGSKELRYGIQWEKEQLENCPKAVRYLLSEEGEKEIFRYAKCSYDRKKNYYLVLKNNIVAFCGNRDLVDKNYGYYDNNIQQIKRILSSLILNEMNAMEIIDVKKLEEIINSDDGKKSILVLLEKVFDEASIPIWNYHHMIARANCNRLWAIGKQKYILGYYREGGVRHQWNQLFHEAYAKVMTSEKINKKELMNCFQKVGISLVESLLIDCEYDFLGTDRNLSDGEIKDKLKFRVLLEAMYSSKIGKEVFADHNPFEDFKDKEKIKDVPYHEVKKYLENVMNFSKGFRKNKELQNDMYEFFKEKLNEKALSINQLRAKNMVDINLEFSYALQNMEQIFMEKYDLENEKNTRKKFNEIMKYYFEKN